nr:immunoglobulin heavy chain junction region [Mus musculus]
CATYDGSYDWYFDVW